MPDTNLGLDAASKKKRKTTDYFYHLSYRLRWNDNDVFGHMNNPYYGVIIDSIINQYLINHCGYRTNKHPQAAIIANTYCDYFGSVSYPGVIEVGLRVVKLGKTSVFYEVGIFKEGEEGVKAVGGSSHIWCDQTNGVLGRPLKEGMLEEMRKGYLRLMSKAEGGTEEGASGGRSKL